MPQLDRKLTKEEIKQLERSIPSHDSIADRQGVSTYRGSLEEIEERHFPWLKKRRRERRAT